jgi:uncharacterized RDD family membrane protein YckC
MENSFIRKSFATWLTMVLVALGPWATPRLQAQEPGPEAKPADGQAGAVTNTLAEEAAVEQTKPGANPAEGVMEEERPRGRGRSHDAIVRVGHDVELKQGESADTIVVIGGSAKIVGRVNDVVVIWGDIDIEGEVDGDVVAVLGDISAGPKARVRGDTVAVGGKVDVANGARLRHPPEGVDFPAWFKQWLKHCVFMMRPLAPQVAWVWIAAGAFLLVYILVAALFNKPVAACVNELTDRPATTFLLGILAKVLVPLVLLILAATGIGLIVVPFVLAGLFFGAVIGKVALLETLGSKLAGQFGLDLLARPLLALIIGAVIIALLYMVPVLGLLTFGVLSLWGLGAAVTAAFGGLKREMPEKMPAAAVPAAPAMAMAGAAGFGNPSAFGSGDPTGATLAAAAAGNPPVMPEALSFPRAGFWERVAAAFLDIVLVSIIAALLHPVAPLVFLAYFAGMWAWKGTTIGGIVLGIKAVRQDGKPLSIPVALVRSLAAAFSVAILFLGYIWIAWDKEKQGWHDKIAGTVVIKVPRSMPLLCL